MIYLIWSSNNLNQKTGPKPFWNGKLLIVRKMKPVPQSVCGKEGIKYLYTIRNKINGEEIFPIGSSCIKKFNNDDLTSETELWKKEFALYHAISNNEFIKFEGEEKKPFVFT